MWQILEEFSQFVSESSVNDILTMMKTQMKETKEYKDLETEDFMLRIGEMTSHITLSWIYTKTSKYSGTDILKALIKYCQENGFKSITGYGIKGHDSVIIDGKRKSIVTNGYYSLMRWGFIPDKGVKFINKTLKTNYSTLEDAFSDKEFWTKWKEDGKEYTGEFDVSSNSLSFRVLDKQV